MSNRFRLVFGCYAGVGVALAVVGAVYAASPRPMPYHLEVLGTPWSELDPRARALLLALLHGAGAGALAAATAVWILLLVPFRRGEPWARWAIPAVALWVVAPAAGLAWSLHEATGASTPWAAPLAATALLVAGLVLAYVPAPWTRPRT
jgi:hypothetical protein